MEETTFHSTKHRQRDNVIQQKHEAELHRYKVLLDKQKYINDELRVSLFDIKNRSKTLVDKLGFPDLIEAQVYLDGLHSKGHVVDYRERFRDIERLENELKEAKMFNQKMEVREKELEEENTALKQARDESASAFRQLTKEYKNLEEKHRESVKTHEAASSRRDKDYAKWESFKKWILCAAEVAQFQKYDKEFGFSGKDKAKELLRIVAGKKYKLSQLEKLDDEMLFNASEQDIKEPRLISSPAIDQPGEPASSPLCTSSKVNRPVEDQASSSTPPFPKLIRSYAMKNTLILPTKEDFKDNHSTSIPRVVPMAPVEQTTSPLAPVPGSQTEDESQLPRLPSTALAALVASKPKAAVVLAPDSESEDDSQPIRQSQPPSNISQPVPKSTRVPLAFKEVPSSILVDPSNPSSRRALQLFDLASTPTPTNRPSLPLSSPLSNGGNIRGSEPSIGLGRGSHQDNDLDRYPNHLSQSLLPVYASPRPGDHEDDEPPRKYRRASEGNRVPSGSSIGARTSPIPALTTTSEPRQRQRKSSLENSRSRSRPRVGDRDRERDRERVLDKENTSASHSRNSERRKSDGDREHQDQDRGRSHDTEENGKGKRKAALIKKGPLEDYSIYKGRGRYGKGKEKDQGVETTTINERYAIDPSRNGGLEYEYDEVVRGKEKRKQLLAEDCDDCREYYRAIGPMPPRLQAPLWKSPAKSASVSPCRLHGHGHGRQHTSASAKRRREDFDFDDGIFDDFDTPSCGPERAQDRRQSPSRSRSSGRSSRYRRNDIDTHKQNISRHRAAWARGTTPPGYWDIGFPNTQMTEEINEKAREIHKRKMEMVEREATREGGRYRKR